MTNTPILAEESMEFLAAYLNHSSPTGFEWKNQKRWMDYMFPFVDTFLTDTYGTAVGIINPDAEYKVVLEAHADEISWYVNFITEDGMIFVVANGGSDQQIAPSKKVLIHTEQGIVTGIFGWPAIHTRNKDIKPEKDNIFIDIGRKTKKEVEAMGIEIGNVVTYPDKFFVLNDDKFVGRALDNRMGGFMISQVARLLFQNKIRLPFGIYFTNSVQEEVGTHGAKMISQTIHPNVVLVTDVTHDTTSPTIKEKKEGHAEIGKGPILPVSPSVHNKLRKRLIETARQNDIPFQPSVSSKSTGTDTDAFAFSNGGTASALISLPIRYMHTTVEMVDKNDVENAIKLLYHSLLSFEDGERYDYIKPLK